MTNKIQAAKFSFEAGEKAESSTRKLRELIYDLKRDQEYAPSALVNVVRHSRWFPGYWDKLAEFLEVAIPKVDFKKTIYLQNNVRLNYESYEDFYEKEMKPWLGPLDKLLNRLQQFRTGELTHKEVQAQIEKETLATRTQQLAQTMTPKSAPADGEVGNGRQRRSYNITPTSDRGTDRTYLASRIARDHPKIDARLKAGKFRSIRAAAIEAGIVKIKSTLEQLQSLWAKATPQERRAFLKEVQP